MKEDYENMIKPPIGLKPKWVKDQMRFREVCAAIARYFASGLDINPEWIQEYNEFKNKETQTMFVAWGNGEWESYAGKQIEEVIKDIKTDKRYSNYGHDGATIMLVVPMYTIDNDGNEDYL